MDYTDISRRVFLSSDPFPEANDIWGPGPWPARWVRLSDSALSPTVLAFRLHFSLALTACVRVHVSANERYNLYLNGELVGRGSERGDTNHWFFESYDLILKEGSHVLVAIVWNLGDAAPIAQISTGCARFLLATEHPFLYLATGTGAWEVVPVGGYRFTGPGPAWGTGSKIELDGNSYPWGIESGETEGWSLATTEDDARPSIGEWGYSNGRLTPASLPPMINEARPAGQVRYACFLVSEREVGGFVDPALHDSALADSWSCLLNGNVPLTFAATTKQRVILDLGDYFCAYPKLRLSGGKGARVRIMWSEGLYTSKEGDEKGHRDQVDGKWFRGTGDTFIADGGALRAFSTLWWQAGRYIEVEVLTADEPLTITELGLQETRYPLEWEGTLSFSDPRIESTIPVLMRSVQMCAHETYIDCPFYEQLMYVGDTRLESLLTYTITSDSRLPVKAVLMFAGSCDHSGLTASRYPARGRQTIPGFSLWWIAMIYDLALWRGEREIVASCLTRIRSVLDAFLELRREDGLIRVPDGWHFVDWVPSWALGCPPHGNDRVCGITAWQLVLALRQAADLEIWAGSPAAAQRYVAWAAEIGAATEKIFWDSERGLMADNLSRTSWSQHAQCLAILSGYLSPERARTLADTMLKDSSIVSTTIYFSHYLFEALTAVGRGQDILEQMTPWFSLVENGFHTTFESPGHSRSDCHAWGAHPLYHYSASILGVRPAGFAYSAVLIRPQLGDLKWAGGSIIHPKGTIEISFVQTETGIHAEINLPIGLYGMLEYGSLAYPLEPGTQSFDLED